MLSKNPCQSKSSIGSEKDVWCLTSTAIRETKHDGIERAADICGGLPDTQAREECFFQSAEQITKQDRVGALEQAFTFCNKATAYQEHCHAHIIEYAAATFQPPANLLQVIADHAGSKTDKLQAYYLTMKARHRPQQSLSTSLGQTLCPNANFSPDASQRDTLADRLDKCI